MKKRKWKMSAAERKASYELRSQKRLATIARKAGKPTPKAWSESQLKRMAAATGLLTPPASEEAAGPGPSADHALRQTIDTLSFSNDLDAVLVAIRDKVQRIADEQPPSEAARPSTDETIRHLSQAIRGARWMRSHWGMGGQRVAQNGNGTISSVVGLEPPKA